ncbi:acyltransferase [Levilactobacillus fujinensis]|uniref:Acyltransferase n=1 Tax=Levilactobacillus fujinensis TaxID=2486024 RepID=A0ABW1TDQ1_9LACO|nr:acyltransferase [Levilactobacillus fujinensis]
MAERKKRRYLHEVDLMRVIFIGGVLLNHTTTAFESRLEDTSTSQLLLEATHLALHFTRMGFMFMTGLVLVLNYYHRDHHWLKFWKKRYLGAGVPYIGWNAIIMLVATLAAGPLVWPAYWSHLGDALLKGNEYYMYYIVVTFQLYLLFPLIVKLFKRFANQHALILGISFVLQLLLVVGIKYWLPHVDTTNWWYLFKDYGVNVLVYQFYFIAGGLVAVHYDAVVAWVNQHHRLLGWGTLGLSIGTVALYFGDKNILHLSAAATFSVHQPFIFIYDVVIILFVFWLGLQYVTARQGRLPEWIDRLIQAFSKVSFGIYLTQSLPIFLLYGILGRVNAPAWVVLAALPLGYLLVAGGALGISWFCYKVPPFGILIGRPNWHPFSKGAHAHVKSHLKINPTAKASINSENH